MIHNFYIIRPNGICIFHEKFGSLEEEPQSIAGFLTAISMFSKAIIGEDIKILATENFKFIFRTYGKLTFVSFIDKLDKLDKMHQLLENIKNCFYQSFPDVENELLSGNLRQFEKFKLDLKNIINSNFD